MPVWIRDISDPHSDIGIELPFDIVLSFVFSDGSVREYRFIGKADGLHDRDGTLYLHENKTASRLDDAWSQSFLLSSQITGYCIALAYGPDDLLRMQRYMECQYRYQRTMTLVGIVREVVPRFAHHFEHWLLGFCTL
jgi:hypothetical protein